MKVANRLEEQVMAHCVCVLGRCQLPAAVSMVQTRPVALEMQSAGPGHVGAPRAG
jgi:hypothetical protein